MGKRLNILKTANFAVPFSKLYQLSDLSNAKFSRRPTEMQTVNDMSAIPTAVLTAGTEAVSCFNFAAFLVTPHSKYSVDQHRSVSEHIYHTITIVRIVGDDSNNCIERRKNNDLSTDWLPDVEER
jgi:hypothetical protein